MRRLLPCLGPAAAAIVLAACCAWTVSEQDIYWQIRAGDELWRGLPLPEHDTWSFSARGAPWLNIQWLATLLLRGLWGLGAEPALVLGRCVAVAGLLGLLAAAAASRAPRGWRGGLGVVASLALCHAALLPRLQLRSDFLVLLVYAAVQLRMLVPTRRRRGRRLVLLGAVVLAANLHAGTAPFVALLVICALAGEPLRWRRRLAWMGGAVAGLGATPYGARVAPLLWAHVDYYNTAVMENPDHQVLSAHYVASVPGLATLLGLLLAAAAAAALRARGRALPGALRQSWAAAALLALLLAMACNRVRVLPYVIVLLPALWLRAQRLLSRPALRAGAAATLLVLGVGAVASSAWALRAHYGLTANAVSFPVGSVAFLRAARPRGQILHTFRFGAYMVWHLRDYPVYLDTRESMYWPLQREVLAAYHSPAATQALITRYDVHTVLMPIPPTRYLPGVGFEDVTGRFMDRDHWALVYFDAISFVMVAREPAHAALIAAHEYTLLRPNLPANVYAVGRTRSAARDRIFVAELARCRAEEPSNAYCMVAEASYWRTSGGAAGAARAAAQLRAAARALTPGTAAYLTAMVELQAALRGTGATTEAARIEAELGAATVLAPG